MTKTIMWFRKDLRHHDNPALANASHDSTILPVFIDDPCLQEGAASRVWLHHALAALDQALDDHLNVYHGDSESILRDIVARTGATRICWNRCYEPAVIARDAALKERLSAEGISCQSFNGSLLWEPWTVLKSDGTPYKVFTPFYRKGCLNAPAPRQPLDAVTPQLAPRDTQSLSLADLQLLPRKTWVKDIAQYWDASEQGGRKRMQAFIKEGLVGYKTLRNVPAKPHVSRLSPYLHWGHVSPNTVWYAAQHAKAPPADVDHFLSELGWREFSYYLLYHFPSLPRENLQPSFDAFPWVDAKDAPHHLHAWQHGHTGYPIVDAGMRELWQTGYLHNRVRMIVGSFLVKNLLIHWHHGADWFWDCLFDADLASNSASWQWVAGSGADAAPYFRIFNPITQSENFDPEGDYIRTYVPELKNLPTPYLFAPWEAPKAVLEAAGVVLGETYPHPIVDLARSRERALEAYAQLKQAKATC